MKLGHLILILSLGVIIAGIMLMGISGINASHPFLYQNMLVTNGLLKSKETKSDPVNVTERGPAMYVILKVDPTNIPLSATVKDPTGSIVSSSTFSQDLVADFKPENIGKYNLILMNQGNTDVKINALVGYLPSFGENESQNYNALGGIFLGASLLVFGSLGFAGGIFISIKNRSSQSRSIKKVYTFSMGRAKKVISCFWSRGWKLRRSSSNTIHCNLITQRLGELEKFREKAIFESEFGEEENQELTEDESSFKS